jgi:hypothetical protein
MLNATTYYRAITKDYSRTLAGTASGVTVSRETDYFLANIGKVKSADALLKNNKLYAYVMKAFGLTDKINAKGLIRKVLEGGLSGPKSLATTLHDPRYKALATAFNFAANGAATTSMTAAQQGTADKYVQQTLEANVGQQNEGAAMALYFQRMAPNISTAYNILGDKTLLKVVQTAFGLPVSMSQQNIDMQAKLINNQLKIGDLQNPAKLKKFIERFTATYDSKNTSTAPTNPTSAMLFSSAGGAAGVSSDLLLRLANLKLGGS